MIQRKISYSRDGGVLTKLPRFPRLLSTLSTVAAHQDPLQTPLNRGLLVLNSGCLGLGFRVEASGSLIVGI